MLTTSQLKDRLKLAASEVGGLNRLSELIGVPRRTLGNWIDGTSEPKASTLAQIVELSGVSSAWLLMGEGRMYSVGNATDSVSPKLMEQLALLAEAVHKEMDVKLPAIKLSAEAADLFNQLKSEVVDLKDLEQIEATFPRLKLSLKRRLEKAKADPGTGKRVDYSA